jgi:predicted nucleic acid-binding protein
LIVAFDATVLVFVLDDQAKPPLDKQTGEPVTRCAERVKLLIETLQRDGAKIIIPTPSIAEVLVKAQAAAPEWLRVLNSSKHFRVSPFDERAAVEFAARQANRPRNGGDGPPRQKAKFDDQIVAIAAVEGAEILYSDDKDIRRLVGNRCKVVGIAELPLPTEGAQGLLPLPEPGRSAENPD